MQQRRHDADEPGGVPDEARSVDEVTDIEPTDLPETLDAPIETPIEDLIDQLQAAPLDGDRER